MNIRKTFFSFFALLLMFGVMLPLAKADATDESTELTFSQPVQIPGQILPAGTYRFVVMDSETTLNTVRIFSPDRTKVYATLNTVQASRSEATDDTVVSFAEPTSGQPDALKTWFYRGKLTGHEFVYPNAQEHELAQDSKIVVT